MIMMMMTTTTTMRMTTRMDKDNNTNNEENEDKDNKDNLVWFANDLSLALARLRRCVVVPINTAAAAAEAAANLNSWGIGN
jgi:hypothetical protein